MHRRSVLFPDPERPKITTHLPRRDVQVYALQDLVVPERPCADLAQAHYRAGLSDHAGHRLLLRSPSRQSPLQPSLEVGEDAGEYPVDDRRHHQHLQVLEVLAPDLRGAE